MQSKSPSVLHSHLQKTFQLTSKWHLWFPPFFHISQASSPIHFISWILVIPPAIPLRDNFPPKTSYPEVIMSGTKPLPLLTTTPGVVVASGPLQIPSCAPLRHSARNASKINHFVMALSSRDGIECSSWTLFCQGITQPGILTMLTLRRYHPISSSLPDTPQENYQAAYGKSLLSPASAPSHQCEPSHGPT